MDDSIELTPEMEDELTDKKGGPNDYQQPSDEAEHQPEH